MIEVELIYDNECPNVDDTRSNLAQALARAGLQQGWTEWNRANPRAPERTRRFGSPTVLINGNDAAGAAPSDGSCCRVYELADRRRSGAPTVDLIVNALRKAQTPTEIMPS